jgi:hypothetical protein
LRKEGAHGVGVAASEAFHVSPSTLGHGELLKLRVVQGVQHPQVGVGAHTGAHHARVLAPRPAHTPGV